MKKIDTKSINFKLWEYFVLFAIMLLGLVWLLQVFFLDTFYETTKLRESNRIAESLVLDYDESKSIEEFAIKLRQATEGTDIYVRVETENGRVLLVPDDESDHLYFFERGSEELRKELLASDSTSYSDIRTEQGAPEVLFYACYLNIPDNMPMGPITDETVILYMFSPLYPVKSTVSILRSQLLFISAIALILAMSAGIYIARRIGKPIKAITASASEIGKGHYNVALGKETYSEVNELADALTKVSTELENADTYRKDLIANVSHDLKTPLTMIKSYAEMIKDLSGDDPAKRESHLDVIIDEANRLNVLVSDLLTVSRLQGEGFAISPSPFDICEATANLLSSYEILAERGGFRFKLDAPERLLVLGDEARIQQVIVNLINNAIKYSGDAKDIQVVIKESGKMARCEIIDHGPGIPEEELSHIWERYYKSSANHSRSVEGTGLGLSIVKGILNLHKAHYGVNSEVGKGSTFWFELSQAE